MSGFTKGPWHVRDLRATEMERLGWTGPSIDRILITSKDGPEIARDEGDNCVVARIQFDNRPEKLTEDNLADARLMAAAPDLIEALIAAKIELWSIARDQWTLADFKNWAIVQQIDAALNKARGAA